MEAWPPEPAEYSLTYCCLCQDKISTRGWSCSTHWASQAPDTNISFPAPVLVVPVLFSKSGHLQNASIGSWLSTGWIPAVVNHCPRKPKADLVSHSSLSLQELWAGTDLLSTLHGPGATLSLLAPQAQGEEFLSTVITLPNTSSPSPLKCTGISIHKIHSSYQNSSGTASLIFCLLS